MYKLKYKSEYGDIPTATKDGSSYTGEWVDDHYEIEVPEVGIWSITTTSGITDNISLVYSYPVLKFKTEIRVSGPNSSSQPFAINGSTKIYGSYNSESDYWCINLSNLTDREPLGTWSVYCHNYQATNVNVNIVGIYTVTLSSIYLTNLTNEFLFENNWTDTKGSLKFNSTAGGDFISGIIPTSNYCIHSNSNSNGLSMSYGRADYQYSHSFWISGIGSSTSDKKPLFYDVTSDGYTEYNMCLYAQSYTLYWGSDYSLLNLRSGATHHIVVSANSSYCKIYIDGELKGTYPRGTSTVNSLFIFKANSTFTGYKFAGNLDNWRIYKGSLTGDQIRTLYREGVPQ